VTTAKQVKSSVVSFVCATDVDWSRVGQVNLANDSKKSNAQLRKRLG